MPNRQDKWWKPCLWRKRIHPQRQKITMGRFRRMPTQSMAVHMFLMSSCRNQPVDLLAGSSRGGLREASLKDCPMKFGKATPTTSCWGRPDSRGSQRSTTPALTQHLVTLDYQGRPADDHKDKKKAVSQSKSLVIGDRKHSNQNLDSPELVILQVHVSHGVPEMWKTR